MVRKSIPSHKVQVWGEINDRDFVKNIRCHKCDQSESGQITSNREHRWKMVWSCNCGHAWSEDLSDNLMLVEFRHKEPDPDRFITLLGRRWLWKSFKQFCESNGCYDADFTYNKEDERIMFSSSILYCRITYAQKEHWDLPLFKGAVTVSDLPWTY